MRTITFLMIVAISTVLYSQEIATQTQASILDNPTTESPTVDATPLITTETVAGYVGGCCNPIPSCQCPCSTYRTPIGYPYGAHSLMGRHCYAPRYYPRAAYPAHSHRAIYQRPHYWMPCR